jgi:pSer/pThr/pTyr-binding forkhead associated (FHA) protein
MSGGEPTTQFIKPDATARAEPNTDDLPTYVAAAKKTDKVVAKLVLTEGPGAGQTRDVYAGTNSIGREPSRNRIGLVVGDDTISRESHAIVFHDEKAGLFQLFDGGKPNPVYLNGQVVTAQAPLKFGDVIHIGKTSMRFDPP